MHRDLKKSQLYRYHPNEAQKLWVDGYRPIKAISVRKNDIIAFRRHFGGFEYGETMDSQVVDAKVFMGEVRISHWDAQEGAVQQGVVDERDEVWVKRPA